MMSFDVFEACAAQVSPCENLVAVLPRDTMLSQLSRDTYQTHLAPDPPLNITSSNFACPRVAGVVQIKSPMVPKEFEEFLDTPDVFDLPDAVCPRKVPFTRPWVDNWAEVAATLWDARLIDLCLPEVVKARFGRILRAGCFGVIEKLTSLLRFVVDRRGPNAQEFDILEALRHYAFATNMDDDMLNFLERLLTRAHACQTTDIIFGPGSYLLINIDDISDYYYYYYYTLALTKTRVHETSICFPVAGTGLLWGGATRDRETLAALGDQEFECCLTAPAMGDKKAAGIAQIVNQSALHSHGLLKEGETWMTYGYGPPNSSVWEGVYLDDNLSLGIIDPPRGPSRTCAS